MVKNRWFRRLSVVAAAGVLLQVGCPTQNFAFDVAVMTATGLTTTGIMTVLNSLVNAFFPAPTA